VITPYAPYAYFGYTPQRGTDSYTAPTRKTFLQFIFEMDLLHF